MALQIRFEAGAEKASTASAYFKAIANDLLDAHLPAGMPRHFLFVRDGMPNIPVRIWCGADKLEDRVLGLLPWLGNVMRAMTRLSMRSRSDDLVHEFADLAFQQDQDGLTLFLEMLAPEEPFSHAENVELVLALVAGRVHMLSAPNVILIQLDAHLHGLAIAGVGSYVLEELREGALHVANR